MFTLSEELPYISLHSIGLLCLLYVYLVKGKGAESEEVS